MTYKGSYILVISLDTEIPIQVGKLGKYSFPQGYYLYSGSAFGGLQARIKRHLAREKKLYWHIDFLLTIARVEEIWATYAEERVECQLARALRGLAGASVPVKGFGSSDCRCDTHLVHLSWKPDLTSFQDVVGDGIILERLPEIDKR